jgi:hypothetical protein
MHERSIQLAREGDALIRHLTDGIHVGNRHLRVLL